MRKTSRARLAPPSRPGGPPDRQPLLLPFLLPVLLLVASAAALSGCTDDSGQGGAPSDTATGAGTSLRERAAPYDVHYRRVVGDIRQARGDGTLRRISEPVRTWIDAGFVQGPWPRHGFGNAFVPFRPDITASARRDADLLTLQPEGGSFVDVVPRRRQIGVSVTGVRGHVVGATARVHVRVLGVSGEGERTAVSVSGDLFLTRVESNGWKIFGYRLDRWVGKGAMTRSRTKPDNEASGQSSTERKGSESNSKHNSKGNGKPPSNGNTSGGS